MWDLILSQTKIEKCFHILTSYLGLKYQICAKKKVHSWHLQVYFAHFEKLCLDMLGLDQQTASLQTEFDTVNIQHHERSARFYLNSFLSIFHSAYQIF